MTDANTQQLARLLPCACMTFSSRPQGSRKETDRYNDLLMVDQLMRALSNMPHSVYPDKLCLDHANLYILDIQSLLRCFEAASRSWRRTLGQ